MWLLALGCVLASVRPLCHLARTTRGDERGSGREHGAEPGDKRADVPGDDPGDERGGSTPMLVHLRRRSLPLLFLAVQVYLLWPRYLLGPPYLLWPLCMASMASMAHGPSPMAQYLLGLLYSLSPLCAVYSLSPLRAGLQRGRLLRLHRALPYLRDPRRHASRLRHARPATTARCRLHLCGDSVQERHVYRAEQRGSPLESSTHCAHTREVRAPRRALPPAA